MPVRHFGSSAAAASELWCVLSGNIHTLHFIWFVLWPFYSALGRQHLECWDQSWAPSTERPGPSGGPPGCCHAQSPRAVRRGYKSWVLGLEQRRLRGSSPMAVSTRREVRRGRSRALLSAAQGQAQRPRAQPGAPAAPPAPQAALLGPGVPREGTGAPRGAPRLSRAVIL